MSKQINVDIIIIGGGIAGLWTLNRVIQLGFSALLLESGDLGGKQTLSSQGIIHGGIKFALGGFLNAASEAIALMPERWKACLEAQGDLDLSQTKLLSQYQYLWSSGGLSADVGHFFAGLALSSRVQTLKKNDYPEVFHNPLFKGRLYRLNEVVLDVPSLIEALSAPHKNRIFKINTKNGSNFQFDSQGNIANLMVRNKDDTLNLKAERYIFTAGAGNADLLKDFFEPPKMQTRPLHMSMIKHHYPHKLYAHCITADINPRLTITSHLTHQGDNVWYLGGKLAEEGVHRTETEQNLAAQQELKTLFPGLDFSDAQYASFRIDRAEYCQKDGKRPSHACVINQKNYIVAWPTKLALTPLMTDEILKYLEKDKIHPKVHANTLDNLAQWEKPNLALPPWEKYF